MTGRVRVFTQDFADANWLQQRGINCEFGLLPLGETQAHSQEQPTEQPTESSTEQSHDPKLSPALAAEQTQRMELAQSLPKEQTQSYTAPQTLPSTIILFLPREKERLEFLLHFIAAHMPIEGKLWLVGENKAGIKSAETRLKQRFSKVLKRDSARHCVLYTAQEPKTREVAAHRPGLSERDQLRDAAADATGASKEEPLWETVADRPGDEEQVQTWDVAVVATGASEEEPLRETVADRPPGDEEQVQTSDAAADAAVASEEDPLWERALLATNSPAGQDTRGNKSFSSNDYLRAWSLETNAGQIKLLGLPGAFAQGRLDKGTALLLDYLQNASSRQLKIKGKVLDFGCGSGAIGLYLKRQYPDIDLEMLDTSAVALESTRLSLQLNNLTAQITASDGLDAAKGRYDWIISNPPFHKGVATDLDIARRFISNAPARLRNRGRMLLVCNRHLPYEAWLTEAFVGFEKVSENREFKVLQAHGPRRL